MQEVPGPPRGDKVRARALAERAKADLTRGGPKGKADLARVEAWLKRAP